jgi:hypothetical protein
MGAAHFEIDSKHRKVGQDLLHERFAASATRRLSAR